MEECVLSVASALVPSIEQIRGFKSIMNDIVKALHKTGYKMGRIKAGGSYGKDTGISTKMDLDIAFFLNEFEPPFDDDCLLAIKIVLAHELDIHLDNIKQFECSFRFRISCDFFDEEVQVDLLPAANYVLDSQHCKDTCAEQHRRTLEKLKAEPFPNRRLFRSSYTEAAVQFVKSQSENTRQLVRLAKFWKDTVYNQRTPHRVTGTCVLLKSLLSSCDQLSTKS